MEHMTEGKIRIKTTVQVPVRTDVTMHIINVGGYAGGDGTVGLDEDSLIDIDTDVIDLEQFSDNMTAGLPLFLPIKPHRSGLHDNDNAPYTY
jgi:hypothetical protein